MLKSISEYGNELNKLNDAYFHDISKLAQKEEDQGNKDLLKSIEPIVINYIYLKSCHDRSIEPDYIIAKLIIDSLEKLHPICVSNLSTVENLEPAATAAGDDSNSNQTQTTSDLRITLVQINADMLVEICCILNDFAYESYQFNRLFVESGGLDILFKYISSDTLLDAYVTESRNISSDAFKFIDTTMRRLIGSLVCLGRTFTAFKNEWKRHYPVQKLLYYLERTQYIIDNKLYASMAIAYTADDEDIEHLPQYKELPPLRVIFTELASMIAKAANSIKGGVHLERSMFQIDDSNDFKEVCSINHMETHWSLINIFQALYHLSVSDKFKNDIYFRDHLDKHLASIIYKGNEIEKEYSLMVLWQLCFNKQIASDVANNNLLYSYINELSLKTASKLQVNALGVIWMVKSFHAQNLKQQPKLEKSHKQIVISYDRDDRENCMKIRSKLEKEGYLIWTNEEESLEKMSNAIENSVCVLVCMSEKYKQSSACRAEAEYAFQLGQPIIPLIMEKDYKPDGWLGIILGSKVSVDFKKYDLDESLRLLIFEIGMVVKSNQINPDEVVEIVKPAPPESIIEDQKKQSAEDQPVVEDLELEKVEKVEAKPIQQIEQPIEQSLAVQKQKEEEVVVVKEIKSAKSDSGPIDWSESQVYEWFVNKDISSSITRHLWPCDGRILYEFYLIKNETPDFFYKSLGNWIWGPTLREITLFSFELKKLFSN